MNGEVPADIFSLCAAMEDIALSQVSAVYFSALRLHELAIVLQYCGRVVAQKVAQREIALRHFTCRENTMDHLWS